MSTCKDCISYDRCQKNYLMQVADLLNIDIDTLDKGRNKGKFNIDDDTVCEFFKDKSKIVELPCNIEDTIYQLWYSKCHLGEDYPDSYGCCGCMDECDAKLDVKPFIVPNLKWILANYFNFNNGVGSYYFSKTEAENALNNIKNKGEI